VNGLAVKGQPFGARISTPTTCTPTESIDVYAQKMDSLF
jgi:hypothetical protein